MATLVTRLSNTGNLLLNGTFDEVTTLTGAVTRTTTSGITASQFDEVTGMITTANLVVYLDASKPESYPSTGTRWVDISGNTNNGTLFNSPTYTAAAPSTFTLNGTSQYVNITRPVQDDFTLACWFQTTSASGAAGSWWQGMGLIDGEVAGSANDFGVTIGGGKLMFGQGNPDQTLISSSSYNDGVWHYVAGTRNKASGNLKLYVDGALVNSATFTNINSLTSPTNITIGALQTIGSYYGGNVASVQIYNRDLSLAEIQNNFNVDAARFSRTPLTLPGIKREANTGVITAGSFDEFTGAPIIDSSLILWMDAGQTTSYPGTGSTWTDLSTKGNNATLNANVTFSSTFGGSLSFLSTVGSSGTLTSSKFNTTYTGKTLFFVVRLDPGFTVGIGYRGMIGTVDATPLRNHNFYVFGNGTNYLLHYSYGDGTTNYGTVSNAMSVTTGQWFMVAVSQDASSHSYYLNGSLLNTLSGGTAGFRPYNTTTTEYIGRADQYFWGDIAVGMMYSRALSADEINQNYNALRRRFGI